MRLLRLLLCAVFAIVSGVVSSQLATWPSMWLFVELFVGIFVVEIALFWAATALANVEVDVNKLLAGSFLAGSFWTVALSTFRFLTDNPQLQLLEPGRRWMLVLAGLGCLVGSWAVPA